MTSDDAMHRIDALLSHVWMVRAFIKHSEEAEEDPELHGVQRELYDAMHAMGPAWEAGDSAAYLKQVRKKLGKLRRAAEQFGEIQPEVSTHMNFRMAVRSLNAAIVECGEVLGQVDV